MNRRTPYTYSILRYVHDVATREFVSIGVVLYAPNAGYLAARCTKRHRRASSLFLNIDTKSFHRLTGFVEREINRLGQNLSGGLPLLGDKLDSVLNRVLPKDDSAMQFSPAGAGVSSDLARTLDELYERFVARYEKPARERRSDEEVWRVFRKPLADRDVVHYLTPHKIAAENYEYEFHHAWKNELWHALEPMSFDLADEHQILEKAVHWLGRTEILQSASKNVRLHVLLGEPSDGKLRPSFERAQNVLNKMPVQKDFYRESEAESFAESISAEIIKHEV